MKLKFYILLLFLFLVYSFSSNQQLFASHAVGGDLAIRCLGNGQYQIVFTYYNDCAGINAPAAPSVNISSQSCGQSFNQSLQMEPPSGSPPGTPPGGEEVPFLCAAQQNQSACQGGNQPGLEVYTYTATITLNQECPDWTVSYNLCCRNSAITNLQQPGSQNFYIESVINNTSGLCSSTPSFTGNALQYACANQLNNLNFGAIATSGDSLAFSLINPMTTGGNPINYSNPGFDPYNPMNLTGPLVFNPQTGQISFTPAGTQVIVLTLLVEEFSNGVFIGSTVRDIQIYVINCNALPDISPIINLSGGTQLDSTVVETCPQVLVSFDIVASTPDANVNIQMTSNVGSAIPTASFNITGSGNGPITGAFSWTPGINNVGIYFFTVTVSDDACPFPGQATFSYQINVLPGTSAGQDKIYCEAGGPQQLQASGGTSFTWTPTAGLSDPNIANPLASPTQTTSYIVQSNLNPICKNTDTVTVFVADDFTYTISDDDSLCQFQELELSVNPDPVHGPYNITWSPSTGINTTSGPNVTATPLMNTTYNVTMVSADGCLLRDSINLHIQGAAPKVTLLYSTDTICPNGPVFLNAIGSQSCGENIAPCITDSEDFIIGMSNNSSVGQTFYPAIYGNSSWGARHQMLYKATELQAMGANAGLINSIAFNISLLYGETTYQDFTISLKCVGTMAELNNWQFDMTTVYGPKNVEIQTGWNTYEFDTNYEWDGVSDIVVEVCFNNSSATANSPNFYTNTTFTSVIWNNNDFQGICSNNSITGMSVMRPNARFGVCMFGLSDFVISWEPASLFTVTDSFSTIAYPEEDVTLEVFVDDNGCVGTASLDVIVTESIFVDAGEDISICELDPIQLVASVSGAATSLPVFCGANSTPCNIPSPPVQAGTSNSSRSLPPNPFAAQFTDGRIQMIYTAAELNAGGFDRGTISAIAFEVVTKNSTIPFNNFQVRIGCTTSSQFGGDFVQNLDLVYSGALTTAQGWNIVNFTNTYDWDGFTNLIVEICYKNSSLNNSDAIRFSNSTANSVIYNNQNFAPVGSCEMVVNPAAGGLSNMRPNIRFTYCSPDVSGFTFSWSPSDHLNDTTVLNPIFTPPGNGSFSYILHVTDGVCENQDTVTLNVSETIITEMSYFYEDCEDTIANVVVNMIQGVSPFDVVWNTGLVSSGVTSDTLFGVGPGTYIVTITDAISCAQVSDTIIVSLPDFPEIELEKIDVLCHGEETGVAGVNVIVGTAPFTYLWSNTNQSASNQNIAAGMYAVTVTDFVGCVAIDSIEILQPDPIVTELEASDASCYQGTDGAIDLVSISGGSPNYTFLWSNQEQDPSISGLAAGTFILQIQDENNCIAYDTAVVNEPDSFLITVTTVDASCFNSPDGSASANVGGDVDNYTFEWNTPVPQLTPDAAEMLPGEYILTVTDTAGCSQFKTVTIGSPPAIEVAAVISDVSCFGIEDGSISATVISGGIAPFEFEWDNNEIGEFVENLASGTYVLTVTDSQGCELVIDDLFVGSPDPLALSVETTDVSCAGINDGTAEVQITGGTPVYQVNWSNNQTGMSIQNLSAGDYFAVVTDNNGCTDSITFVINEPEPLELISLNATDASCPGFSDGVITAVVTGGVAPYEYEFSGIGTFPSSETTGIPAGDYSVVVSDANNCTVEDNISISEPDPVIITFFEEKIDFVIGGEPVILESEISPSGDYTYVWTPSVGLSCVDCHQPFANPLLSINYQLEVIDENNCSFTNTIFVEVDNPMILYIPNAFSPNNDGINDILYAYGISIESIDFQIYDRWGELVFHTNDINEGWDGTFMGRKLNPGVYIYYIEATYIDGQKRIKKGSLTLIR